MSEARRQPSPPVDEPLRAIGRGVLSLAAAVEHQYHLLARALADHEEEALERVSEEDARVDLGELALDEQVVAFLSARGVGVAELRRALATAKAARELERAGDEADNAARSLASLGEDGRRPALDEPLARVACEVAAQIERACLALVTLDAEMARVTIAADRAVNERVRALRAATLGAASDVEVVVPYVNVGRCLERGGDHAKVVAKLALGAATGVEARHRRARTTLSRRV